MKYITSRELSEKWGVSQRRIVCLASTGKIDGAKLYGRSWMFPEDSAKPADGRTRAGRAERALDCFRYPIFEFKDPSSFNPPLSDEEMTIKAVVEAFYACRFQDAEALLGDLPEKAENRYIRMAALYCGCMVGISCCDTRRFLDCYGKLSEELQGEFPHKAEMGEYLHIIDAALGEDEYYSSAFHDNLAGGCHESFLPRLCNLSALRIAFGNQTITSADLMSCEINCSFLEKTDNYSDLQALHVYLACAYSMAGRNEECCCHFRRALELAEQHDMFYTIALMQYNYLPEALEDALRGFSGGLRARVAECNRMIRECHAWFTDALQFGNVYKELRPVDHVYVMFAVQGLTNKEVARRTGRSIGTVGKRYGEIYALLGVKSKDELVKRYRNLAHGGQRVRQRDR